MNNRHKARTAAVQALYQWDMMGCPIDELDSDFLEEHERQALDKAYLTSLLQGVAANQELIEKAIQPFIDRNFSKVDPIERSILRLGVYEMLFHKEVPVRVILNESIELAKTFGSDHSYKFINGTMDKLAKEKSVQALRA
ncbi:MAG: transcription antitermination factor NusB [Arenicella sp.]